MMGRQELAVADSRGRACDGTATLATLASSLWLLSGANVALGATPNGLRSDVADAGIQTAQAASTPETSDLPPAREPAGSAPAQLEEVIVTAEKRAANSQKVPISVATVTSDQLQASGVTTTLQLPSLEPALQIQNEFGSVETRIRGVGTISLGPGVENAVALYVDGVYYASQLMGGQDLGDVAKISILKGPQGTLFGRNATGGVIQIATKDPTHDTHVDVSTDLDDYLTSRTNIYASGGISDDVAANISASYATQGKGWGTNSVTGRDDVHKINYETDLRSKWLFTPTADTSVLANFDYTDRFDNNGLNIVPFPGTEAYTLLPGFKPSSNPWDTDIATTATDRLKSGGASLTVNTSLPFAQLESISAYRQFAFLAHFTPTASPYPGQDLHPDQAGEQATEELQLVSPDSSVVKWATGVYYFYDSEGTGPGEQINLLPPFFGPTVTAIVNKTQTITNSIAGFGQVTAPLPMLDKTNITAGIRYTHERRNFAGSESVDGVLVPLPPIATTITASRPTWRLALDHNFTDDLLGYVSYSTGFKSGGYNGFDPTNPPYRPETVNAYEGGFKSEFFDRTVRVNAAAFYDTYKNIQVSRYTTTSVIYNGASAKIYGLDLDAETRLGNLKLGGGIELLHTDFTSFASAACSAPNFPLPGITQFSCSATGNRLPYAPQFTGTLTTDYFQSVPGGTLDFNITDYYNSGYFVEPDNRLSQRAYDLLNASIAWKSADDRYSVRLYATNLLDKAVFSFAGTNATQYSADYGNPPRLVGVHLDYGF